MGTKQTQNCVGGTKFNFKDWGLRVSYFQVNIASERLDGGNGRSLSRVFLMGKIT